MKKIKVGIVIDEVLRAKWIQFDRFYAQEFGEEGIPEEQPYVYDYFKEYAWNDTVESFNELKEPEDMPDDINPIHYQVDKDGKADADAFIMKEKVETKYSAREVYNRFMYQDFLLEIHGAAPKMYPQLDLHLNNFIEKYQDNVEFVILSVENKFSIPPTLFFLSKISCRIKNYKFLNNHLDMWKECNILITTDPETLNVGSPWGKKVVKLNRPYNTDTKKGDIEVLQVADLIENADFQKLIKYKEKE